MFSKLSLLALVAPLMVSALKLSIPEAPTSGGTITIKWINEPNDPETWSFELINESFNNAFAIFNNVNPSASSLTLTLPVVPVGPGYTLEAVNIGNINDVFATTGEFSIGDVTSASTAPSSTASATGSSSRSSSVTVKPTSTAAASNTGFSSLIVSATPTTVPSVTATPAVSTTANAAITPSSGASRIGAIGGSAGGFAVILLSAIAGGAMITL